MVLMVLQLTNDVVNTKKAKILFNNFIFDTILSLNYGDDCINAGYRQPASIRRVEMIRYTLVCRITYCGA